VPFWYGDSRFAGCYCRSLASEVIEEERILACVGCICSVPGSLYGVLELIRAHHGILLCATVRRFGPSLNGWAGLGAGWVAAVLVQVVILERLAQPSTAEQYRLTAKS